jgi:hypothetical protein
MNFWTTILFVMFLGASIVLTQPALWTRTTTAHLDYQNMPPAKEAFSLY